MQQRFTSDCAVVCLALFLGVDYEDVAKHCSGLELVRLGLTNHREAYIAALFDVVIEFRDASLIDRGRPAVLTVPSLNSPKAATHAVYWNGETVLDPNKGRAGKRFYTNQSAWEHCIEGYQRAGAQGDK